MNNITIGQYIPGNSVIHRLDPRIKILTMIMLIVTVFLVPVELKTVHMISLGAILMITFGIIILAGIPIRRVLKGMSGMVFLLTFTFVLQLFSIRTGTEVFNRPMSISVFVILSMILAFVIYYFTKPYIKFKALYFILLAFVLFYLQYLFANIFKISFDYEFFNYQMIITSDALLRGGFIFVRIISVMMIASLLTFTTSTIELNDGLESVLKPFKYIGLPVSTIAMMLSLTLRSIPTLLEETGRIMKAQTSRGVDFKESKLRDKIMQIISLLIPIFVISFKRAEDLANAMEVRGYVIGAPRTKLDQYRIKLGDVVALISVMALLITYILLRIYAV